MLPFTGMQPLMVDANELFFEFRDLQHITHISPEGSRSTKGR